MKSTSVYFNFPVILIRGIDDYLATSKLEISRSALLKLCLTLDTNLDLKQEKKAQTLADDLWRYNNAKSISLGLRCKKEIKPQSSQIYQVARALVTLGLDNIFDRLFDQSLIEPIEMLV